MSEASQDGGEVKPKIFGPYLVHERLGVGGMATVHRAVQTKDADGVPVALKRLLPHLAEDEAFVKAFVQEAKLSALLKHPNIVAMHELGRVADTYFMAMEYIEGKDIRKCLRQARRAAGPPPLTMVLSVARQMCDALDYAHKLEDKKSRPLGLVHRDISPSNVLISNDGNVKLIDFGIAKATAQSSTRTGTIKGKLAYMSPEALAGDPDPRSDLFSVGVVIHELLTARPLFADKNDFKVIKKIETMIPPPPSRFNAKCPREMDAFVIKALEKRREDRWVSGRAMVDALDEISNEYNLHPSARDVMEWVSWAFSLPVPDRKTGVHEGVDSKSQVSITFVSESHSQSGPKTRQEQSGVVESFLSGAPGDIVENAPELMLGPPTGLPPDEDEVLSEAMWGDGHLEPPPQVDLASVRDVSEPDPEEEAATVLYDKPEGGLSVQSQAMLSKLAPPPTVSGYSDDGANPAQLGFLSFKSPGKQHPRADSVSTLFTQHGAGDSGLDALPQEGTNPTIAEPIRTQRGATPDGVGRAPIPGPGGAATVPGMGPDPLGDGKQRRRGFPPTPSLAYASTDIAELGEPQTVQDAKPIRREAPYDPATAATMVPLAHAETPYAGNPPLQRPGDPREQSRPDSGLPYAHTPQVQARLPPRPAESAPAYQPTESAYQPGGPPYQQGAPPYQQGGPPYQQGGPPFQYGGAPSHPQPGQFGQQPPPDQSGVMQASPLTEETSGIGVGTVLLYLILMVAAVGLGIAIATQL